MSSLKSLCTLGRKVEFQSKIDFILQSLVTFSENMERKRLIQFDPTSLTYKRIQVGVQPPALKQRTVTASGETREKVTSAFPEVDGFIRNLVETKGGYIRKVTFQNCWFIIYELANYRFCHNINRAHKSNNIKFIVDLRSNHYSQMCHDPQCKDFR